MGKIRRCEAQVESLEQEIDAANAALSDPQVAADYEKVLFWTEKLQSLRAEQDEQMLQWESLSEARQALELTDPEHS